MNILLSAYECEPNRGREQGRGWNCALELAKLGHHVWVLTPTKNKALIEPVLATLSLPALTFVYIADSELIRKHLTDKKGTILRYFLWQWKARSVAQALDDAHNFDVVHHVTMGSLTGGSWLWQLKKPFVFGPAGGGQTAPAAFKQYFYDAWWTEACRNFIVNRLIPLHPWLRNTFGHADLVLAANRDSVGLVQRLGAKRAELFFDAGLPEDYFPAEPPVREPADELRLLWVARMFPRKALRLALEAIADVDPAVPVRLTIAGGGSPGDAAAPVARRAGPDGQGNLRWLSDLGCGEGPIPGARRHAVHQPAGYRRGAAAGGHGPGAARSDPRPSGRGRPRSGSGGSKGGGHRAR